MGCRGDSGGPLVALNPPNSPSGSFELVGATSWGYGCAEDGCPRDCPAGGCPTAPPPPPPPPSTTPLTTGCRTLDTNKACVFPFEFEGVTYNGCTNADGEIEPWCS